MDNSAEYLLQFFEVEEREENFDDSAPQAFRRMCETQNDLDNLIAMGVKRLETTKKIMPSIWSAVWGSFAVLRSDGGYGSFTSKRIRKVDLKSEQIQALERIADKSPLLPMGIKDDELQSIRDFLDAAIRAAKEDRTLPDELRLYIIRLAYEAIRNLDECEAGNDFDLKDALQRLFGLLYVAETQTRTPTIWSRLKSVVVKPFVTALVAEAAKQVVGGSMTAVLQITQS